MYIGYIGIKYQEEINMSEIKPRSIRMTDIEYETIKKGAKSRGLPIAKYIIELTTNEIPSGLAPEIMSRLLTISKFLDIPMEYWNNEMKKLFKEGVDSLCALLKW